MTHEPIDNKKTPGSGIASNPIVRVGGRTPKVGKKRSLVLKVRLIGSSELRTIPGFPGVVHKSINCVNDSDDPANENSSPRDPGENCDEAKGVEIKSTPASVAPGAPAHAD